MGLSKQNPETSIFRGAHHRIPVVLVKSYDPIVGLDFRIGKYDFELGVGLLLIFWIGVGLADGFLFNLVDVADIVYLECSVGVEGVCGSGLLAVYLLSEGNVSLFIPCARVFVNIDVGDSLGRILGKARSLSVLDCAQLPGEQSNQNRNEYSCCFPHFLDFFI